MTDDETLKRAEELLTRLETVRARLAETPDPAEAIEVLTELDQIAKATHAELERAQREAS